MTNISSLRDYKEETMGNKAVKTPIGMVSSYFYPFASEPVGAHPVYGARVDMGAAVKGYLSITTASGDISGDDAMLLYFEQFVSGQVDVETTLSDLEVNASIYGHGYKQGRETSNGEDSAPNGAYAFIEPILRKDKSMVYRATFLYKCTAMLSAEKQEADTRKSDFNPKMNAVSLRIMKDNADAWRERQDFATLSEAEAFIASLGGSTAAYGVTISHVGSGASTPGEGTTYVTAGQSMVIDFGSKDPTALYDNAQSVTSSISAHKYTISSISADHEIVAVWST